MQKRDLYDSGVKMEEEEEEPGSKVLDPIQRYVLENLETKKRQRLDIIDVVDKNERQFKYLAEKHIEEASFLTSD